MVSSLGGGMIINLKHLKENIWPSGTLTTEVSKGILGHAGHL